MRHGHRSKGRKTPTYYSWSKMRERCNNPNHDFYDDYGGRGIKVCSEWDSFSKFLEDMGERPDGYTLDRINVEGNYTKANCRWSTPKEQAFNKRKRT